MSHPLSHTKNRRIVLRLAALLLPLLYAINSYARPDMTPLGPNIADKGSAFYHFTLNKFDSADGQRHYKVWTAIPDKAPPASGYPTLYMLDGNAVMDRLSDTLLQKLSEHNPPVLVVIGYQTTAPFDVIGRAYDYTPPVKESHGESDKLDLHGRKGGGSAVFRKLLEETMAPQAEKGLKIDHAKRQIWGHSYGGVFVLDAYLSSSFFSTYYSASPSLNRDNAFLVSKLEGVNGPAFQHKQLYLMEGSGAPGKNERGAIDPQVLTQLSSALATLCKRGLPVTSWAFPGLSHGQMFNVSFPQALSNITQSDAGKLQAPCLQ